MGNDSPLDAALQHWAASLESRGWARVSAEYLDRVVQEFFDYAGRRYEVTTEALWDTGKRGVIRVFVEISQADAAAPREIRDESFLLRPDGTFA